MKAYLLIVLTLLLCGCTAPPQPADITDAPALSVPITVTHSGESRTLSEADSAVILELLEALDYSPHKVCKCLPEYTLQTEQGTYGISLKEGYARCKLGQASLTQAQKEQLTRILT